MRTITSVVESLVPEGGDAGDIFAHALRAVRKHLGMDVAFISEFENGRRYFRHVEANPSTTAPRIGSSDPLEESVCARVVSGQVGQLISDARNVPVLEDIAAIRTLPVGAHLSVPIQLSDGRIYGTFCCFSAEADETLNQRDLNVMNAFAEVVAAQIEKDIQHKDLLSEINARVDEVFNSNALSMVYQPIYNIVRNQLVGFEALSRFQTTPYRSPDLWFLDAAKVGRAVELESRAIAIALTSLKQFHDWCYVSVNASPNTILSGELDRLLPPGSLKRIVLEVTEHEAVEHYGDLAKSLEPLRNRGLRLAIDDAGAGYASFRHILNLKPHIIKLDVSITRDVHIDPSRKALATAIAGFANATGSRLVAEGVEKMDEWNTLRRLGFNKAQGYFLGKPMPLADAMLLPQSGFPSESAFGQLGS